jgi:hypothetical protein
VFRSTVQDRVSRGRTYSCESESEQNDRQRDDRQDEFDSLGPRHEHEKLNLELCNDGSMQSTHLIIQSETNGDNDSRRRKQKHRI